MLDLKEVIDNEDSILQEFISSKGFKTILVYDEFSFMEASWLSDFLNSNSINELISCTFEKGEILSNKTLLAGRDEILNFINTENLYYSLLTTINRDFVVWFSQYRETFIYAGNIVFLEAVYPVNSATVKHQFFENIKHQEEVDIANLIMRRKWGKKRSISRLKSYHAEEFERLEGFWEKYSKSSL